MRANDRCRLRLQAFPPRSTTAPTATPSNTFSLCRRRGREPTGHSYPTPTRRLTRPGVQGPAPTNCQYTSDCPYTFDCQYTFDAAGSRRSSGPTPTRRHLCTARTLRPHTATPADPLTSQRSPRLFPAHPRLFPVSRPRSHHSAARTAPGGLGGVGRTRRRRRLQRGWGLGSSRTRRCRGRHGWHLMCVCMHAWMAGWHLPAFRLYVYTYTHT